MNQYTPNKEITDKNLNKKIKDSDYDDVIIYASQIGINNAFCQIGETANDSFIPNFNFDGIKKV